MKGGAGSLDYSDIAIHQNDNYYGDNEEKVIPTFSNLIRELSYSSSMKKYTADIDMHDYVKIHLRKAYFENKEKLLVESRFLRPEVPRWEPLPDIQGKEEEKRKAELDFEESLIGIFTQDPMDLKMARMEQRLRLVNKEAITYDEIMIKVDQMLSKVPESLKQIFDSDGVVETIDSMGTIEYSQQDLLWKNFTSSHYSVWPKMVAHDENGREITEYRFMTDFEEEMGELYSYVVSYMTQGEVLLYKGRDKSFDE